MTDLQRGAIARATTDAAGYFALPLAALGGSVLPHGFALGQNYPNPFNNTEYRWAARAENGDDSSEWVFGPNFTTLPEEDEEPEAVTNWAVAEIHRLTMNGGEFPSWSPDGRHIAFVSDRDGDYKIYVMELREADSSWKPFDHGDSPSTATPLAVGEYIGGELSAGDSDYFRVPVNSEGYLEASTTGFTDTYGYIEDSSGNVLHKNDDGGADGNFRISAAMEPGTYYIARTIRFSRPRRFRHGPLSALWPSMGRGSQTATSLRSTSARP